MEGREFAASRMFMFSTEKLLALQEESRNVSQFFKKKWNLSGGRGQYHGVKPLTMPQLELLSFIIHWSETGGMEVVEQDQAFWFWITNKHILHSLPLWFSSDSTITKAFQNLELNGLIKRAECRETTLNGYYQTKRFVAITDKAYSLILDHMQERYCPILEVSGKRLRNLRLSPISDNSGKFTNTNIPEKDIKEA